jgi:cytochrome o ubiquinol oxidase subunit 3
MASQVHSSKSHDQKTLFGFWLYLMTDCMIFATLFATYIVLQGQTNNHAGPKELFELDGVLLETLLLLASSFTAGMALIFSYRKNKNAVLNWLLATALLGVGFLALEFKEFIHFFNEGNSWSASAFLSAFFTLVGTHGLHISIGLMWLSIVAWQIHKHGITSNINRRLLMFTLFWHFLDLVWIFIFTIVYLLGVAI